MSPVETDSPSMLCMTLFVWIQVKNLQSTARSHMAEVEERLGMVNPCNTATEGEEEELELNLSLIHI